MVFVCVCVSVAHLFSNSVLCTMYERANQCNYINITNLIASNAIFFFAALSLSLASQTLSYHNSATAVSMITVNYFFSLLFHFILLFISLLHICFFFLSFRPSVNCSAECIYRERARESDRKKSNNERNESATGK